MTNLYPSTTTSPYPERTDLAGYAMRAELSRGRRHAESLAADRSPWELDRQRLTRSAAFRRLSSKMQVFTGVMGDYHRTRLTHTLEVVGVARAVGRALRLNEDLIEALGLAHDLGHPPFGHAGEAVLDRCLAGIGGFCHNEHALRVVEVLERSGAQFPGLNLTLDVLESQQSRIDKQGATLLEAQVVDAADSIAYDTHDADDALKLGLLAVEELYELPLWRTARTRVETRFADLDPDQLRRAVLQELTDWQIDDLVRVSASRLRNLGVETPDQARAAGQLIAPTQELLEQKLEIERFLYERVYRHPRVLAMRHDAEMIINEIFARFVAEPARLPEHFFARVGDLGVERCVGDYIAGMTDRYAEREHRRLAVRSERSNPSIRRRARLTG